MCPAFGCDVRQMPLAIVLSADGGPVKDPRSRRLGANGCPGPWADLQGCATVFALSNVVTRIAPPVGPSRWRACERRHSTLMMSWPRSTAPSAASMLMGSENHKHICPECAEICDECAADCERQGDMQDRVDACRTWTPSQTQAGSSAKPL
jgi:hypothetical protein